MGLFDYVSDLYAALTVQEAYAEEPQKDDGDDESSEGGDEKKDEGGDEKKDEGSEESEGGDDEGGDEEHGDEGGDDKEEEEEEEEEEEAEEPEDIKPQIEEECLKTPACAPLKHHYEECAERVKHQEEQHGKPQEDCVEEFFHMMHCATQCAAPKLFKQLR